ncbi:hypothetical protein Prede_1365 [Prevotella dentalis DSM 3688]|uniref:Uncharacterized protein n=1 Tax=Prevotella dentalis (strain ATCC 49559 / DSM 3688 / JCM 13448 / NCTC 12043 / ES 2772) TaxID=908937 RepID=L0JDL1_PREDD|nr:hypothetical protein Prede_1365 [Prevotella dentalis DSM 3688]
MLHLCYILILNALQMNPQSRCNNAVNATR